MNMSRVLITGGTGFIGSHLIQSLQKEHEVFAVRRTVAPVSGRDAVQWVVQDLSSGLDYSHFPSRVDTIVHLAQSGFYRQLPEKAGDVFAVNVASTFQLLEYGRRVGAKCFVLASTGSVYRGCDKALSETDSVEPAGFYACSKCAAELMVSAYQDTFSTVVLRLFCVYGPGQEGMLIQNLLHKVREGETITIQGKPGMRISPTYVADTVRAFEAAVSTDASGTFNIAGDETITLTELVELMGQVTGRQPRFRHSEGDGRHALVGANGRMKTELGVCPEVNLREGLARMVAGA